MTFYHHFGRDDHQLNMVVKDKEHYDRIMMQIKLDHGMHHEAVKLLDREARKNTQINELKQADWLRQIAWARDMKTIDILVKQKHSLLNNQKEQKKYKSKMIDGILKAKKNLTQELAYAMKIVEGLTTVCQKLRLEKDTDIQLIELLRNLLKNKIKHIHKSGVIHLQEKDLENLKEYRDKYKTLRGLLRDKYLEACKSSQYVTAGIYAQLFSAE